MPARAMWKASVNVGQIRVPVKLYAAVEERDIHFRLLHRKDKAPVTQAMINPDTGEAVPYEKSRRAFVTPGRDMVILQDKELEGIAPRPSRDITVRQFLPPRAIDHRMYLRPYYLAPDGDDAAYAALAAALAHTEREGLACWVMRDKEYTGALRLEAGYLLLVSLRHADQLVSRGELAAPEGRDSTRKERDMAGQLIDMLSAEFDPADYRDEYRARVEELIRAKAQGQSVRRSKAPKRRATGDLTAALAASLERERKRA